MLIGQIIKKLRIDAKLTQADVAGFTGLFPEHISEIEHGRRWGKKSKTISGISNVLSCFGCKLAVVKDNEIIGIID